MLELILCTRYPTDPWAVNSKCTAMPRKGADQALSEVIVNPSIRMLYEFYSIQRNKGPESVNATYLLNGIPRAPKQSCLNGHQQDGGDMYIQSSPYMSSSAPHQEDQVEAAPSRSIVLAKQEDLEGKTGLRFAGWVYLTASEMSAAEKGVSGKGEL